MSGVTKPHFDPEYKWSVPKSWGIEDDDFRVLSNCVHVRCSDCAQASVAKLPAVMLQPDASNMLEARIFALAPTQDEYKYGSRVEAIIQQIQGILNREDETDCVLMFLQYHPQVDELRRALLGHGIEFVDGTVPPKSLVGAPEGGRQGD